MKKRYRLLVLGAALAAVWAAVSFGVAYKLTRRARAPFAESAPKVAWSTVIERRLATRDGQDIGAWLLLAEDATDSALLLHGNGASRRQSLRRAKLFVGAGYNVLAISLRCHGDSSGEVNDFGRSAAEEVVAAVDFLEQEFPAARIVVQGASLGAAAAIFAGARLGERVDSYVLECPYRDLRSAVLNRTRHYLPPVLDRLAYWSLLAVSRFLLDDVDGIAPVEHIKGIPPAVPILLLAGGRDERVTIADVQALARQVTSHGELVVFPEARHTQLYAAQPELYESTILGFLDSNRDGR